MRLGEPRGHKLILAGRGRRARGRRQPLRMAGNDVLLSKQVEIFEAANGELHAERQGRQIRDGGLLRTEQLAARDERVARLGLQRDQLIDGFLDRDARQDSNARLNTTHAPMRNGSAANLM